MLALNRFSDTFYLIVMKHLFIPLISPPGYKPLPPPTPFIRLAVELNPLMKLYKPSEDLKVGFYGISKKVVIVSSAYWN